MPLINNEHNRKLTEKYEVPDISKNKSTSIHRLAVTI